MEAKPKEALRASQMTLLVDLSRMRGKIDSERDAIRRFLLGQHKRGTVWFYLCDHRGLFLEKWDSLCFP